MPDVIFDKESDFEEAVIGVLIERGWESEVIRHPSEADLLKNSPGPFAEGMYNGILKFFGLSR